MPGQRAIDMSMMAFMSDVIEKMLDKGDEPYMVIRHMFGKDTSFDDLRSKIRSTEYWSSNDIPRMLLRTIDIEEARATAVCMGPYR